MAIERGQLAGLLWFRTALGTTVEGAAARIHRLRAAWPEGVVCFFAADEEGGLIEQLSGLEDASGRKWPRLPPARALGRGGDPDVAFAHGREIGRRMRRVGLDVTLAPVVDLDPGPESPVLGTRCFGEDPQLVAGLALGWLRGLCSAGVRGCIKHYPGHGATRLDSHDELPRIAKDQDADRHRAPFAMIADRWRAEDGPLPGVLTAHVVREPSVRPVTLDQAALAKLPKGLGPIWTDSLDMGALGAFGGVVSCGESAAAAGADLLVVGVDHLGGLDLARELTAASTDRVVGWGASHVVPREIPEAWPEAEIERAAAAGFRLLHEQPMPDGEWDWILPSDFGAYGTVAEPAADPGGRRRIGRLLRYDFDNTGSLERALAGDARYPALVGWIHRGLPDSETQEILEAHRSRVKAVVHLLDAPGTAVVPGVWTIETCGYGEGEMVSLERVWKEAPAP